eukprot:8311977-Pyramimonas_sp.AAC.1
MFLCIWKGNVTGECTCNYLITALTLTVSRVVESCGRRLSGMTTGLSLPQASLPQASLPHARLGIRENRAYLVAICISLLAQL